MTNDPAATAATATTVALLRREGLVDLLQVYNYLTLLYILNINELNFFFSSFLSLY